MSNSLPGKHTSVWMDTTDSTNYPRLESGLSVDVVIVGGGIAGLCCAYELMQQGKTVALLEADRIASGVSGFTTAHITSEHNIFYKQLIENFGAEKAKLYAQANQTAIEIVAERVKKHRIACDFKKVLQYLFSENTQDIEKLKEEFESAKSLGLPVSYQETAPVPFPTYGAIVYTDQAQFHPRKYLLALAEIITKNGGKIFEKTRVTTVHEGEPAEVITENGTIRASDVIIATHIPILDRGGFFARMSIERSYVLGFYVEDALPQDMYDNTADPYFYIRTQPTEKSTLILLGGQDHKTGVVKDTESRYKVLEAYARSRFTVKSIAYHWSSQDAYPFDKVPFIGKYTPVSHHLFVATGFQGYGMTHGHIAGRLLTDLIIGKENKWEKVYSPQRIVWQAELPKSITSGFYMTKRMVFAKVGKASSKSMAALSLETGMVIQIGGKKVAVYKDKSGTIHKYSAVCQHLGCIVTFNAAEKSWDCPCHGSRYDVDGQILHGPTVKPLQKFTK